MIENGYYIIESLLYAMRYRPSYARDAARARMRLSEQEIAHLEGLRAGMARVVLPMLGMAKTIASRLPASFIEERLDAGWLKRRANERFPILAERVETHEEKGEGWLQKQASEIAQFLTGRLVWNEEERKLVEFNPKKK